MARIVNAGTESCNFDMEEEYNPEYSNLWGTESNISYNVDRS